MKKIINHSSCSNLPPFQSFDVKIFHDSCDFCGMSVYNCVTYIIIVCTSIFAKYIYVHIMRICSCCVDVK